MLLSSLIESGTKENFFLVILKLFWGRGWFFFQSRSPLCLFDTAWHSFHITSLLVNTRFALWELNTKEDGALNKDSQWHDADQHNQFHPLSLVRAFGVSLWTWLVRSLKRPHSLSCRLSLPAYTVKWFYVQLIGFILDAVVHAWHSTGNVLHSS